MNEPKNHGKKWNPNEISELKKLAKGNTPTGLIAHELGRSEDSVRAKAKENNISLKPTNQSPYDRNVSNALKAKK
jgi:hypothetical protein